MTGTSIIHFIIMWHVHMYVCWGELWNNRTDSHYRNSFCEIHFFIGIFITQKGKTCNQLSLTTHLTICIASKGMEGRNHNEIKNCISLVFLSIICIFEVHFFWLDYSAAQWHGNQCQLLQPNCTRVLYSQTYIHLCFSLFIHLNSRSFFRSIVRS